MEFQLMKKKLEFTCGCEDVIQVHWHLNLLIIVTLKDIFFYKGRKLLFSITYPYCLQNLIYFHENRVYYKQINQEMNNEKFGRIIRVNLIDRVRSIQTQQYYYKIRKIEIINGFLFILTCNSIVREELKRRNQITLKLKESSCMVTFKEQVILLQNNKIKIYNTDLLKLESIKIDAFVFEIKIEANFIIISGYSSLFIFDLVNKKLVAKHALDMNAFNYFHIIDSYYLLRAEKSAFTFDYQIIIYLLDDFTELWNRRQESDGNVFFACKRNQIAMMSHHNDQSRLYSIKYKIVQKF